MQKDTYQGLLKELQEIKQQIKDLNKNAELLKNKIIKEKDGVAINKIRKEIQSS